MINKKIFRMIIRRLFKLIFRNKNQSKKLNKLLKNNDELFNNRFINIFNKYKLNSMILLNKFNRLTKEKILMKKFYKSYKFNQSKFNNKFINQRTSKLKKILLQHLFKNYLFKLFIFNINLNQISNGKQMIKLSLEEMGMETN